MAASHQLISSVDRPVTPFRNHGDGVYMSLVGKMLGDARRCTDEYAGRMRLGRGHRHLDTRRWGEVIQRHADADARTEKT